MDIVIYIRVSTDKQELENQLAQLKKYATLRSYNITKVYTDIASGSENSRLGFDLLFTNLRQGNISHLLFWSLDRFSRSGTLYTLQCLRELDNLNVTWESFQEPFLSSIGEFKDVLVSILSTLAKIEKDRISERTKAGLERTKAEGTVLGRPKGSKDKTTRKKSNYYKRWEKQKR